ncbi:hypothetical protein Kisp01_57720 [Kineosporia sp. NBRC 101677]|nr:hypothetical protein Kisp01_57720 [Kineosporia sp. NBRC 101677]
MVDQDQPVWGTPEPPPGPAGPWGTPAPPPPTSVPAWGSPGPGTQPPPTPVHRSVGHFTDELEAGLSSRPQLEVVENAAMFGEGGYDVHGTDGTPIAALGADNSAASLVFGDLATHRHVLHDAHGQVCAQLTRTGSFLDNGTYEVFGRTGTSLAVIRRENAFGSPRLQVLGSNGQVLRMIGGSWGSSDFAVVDGADESLVRATAHRSSNGFFSSTHRYRIDFGAGLPVLERFLAVVATICMDQVRNKD